MPDQRTEFEIALRDAVTPELRQIAQSMRELINLSREMGEAGSSGLEKFGRSTTQAAERIKNTNRELSGFNSTLLAFTKGLLGPIGTVAGVTQLAQSFFKLAESRAQLYSFAETSRISAESVTKLTRGMQELGVSPEETTRNIGILTGKLKQMGSEQYANELYNNIARAPDGRPLAEALREATRMDDIPKAMDIVFRAFEAAGPKGREQLARWIGITEEFGVHARKMAEQQTANFSLANQKALEYVQLQARLSNLWKDNWEAAAVSVAKSIENTANMFKQQGEALQKGDIKSLLFGTPEERKAAQDSALKKIQEHEAAGKTRLQFPSIPNIGDLLSSLNPVGTAHAEELVKTGQDSNRVLKDIYDVLSGKSGGGGGGGGGGPTFRPGVGGGRSSGAYGQGLGAGRTRAERNNNPGNIKYGEFARSQGATGQDEQGHAIFPDSETGFKAAEALLGGPGYAGMTLGQIGMKWSNGDPGWAANVSKVTGIGIGDVPTPEQRTQIARAGIPVAEGFRGGTGTGGGAVPPEILKAARSAALSGGPGAVYSFIRSQGYHVDTNWCGDFAAAVIKSVGGTPPANPQVASNWRNYGYEVLQPQPGDIAVRRGPRTGSTGSHVTFVGGVGANTFTGVGGNQSRPESTYPIGRFQFFRSDQERATIDRQQRSQNPFEMGTASIDVNFNNVPQGVKTSGDSDGVFKQLKINRTNQSAKSGGIVTDYNRFAYE